MAKKRTTKREIELVEEILSLVGSLYGAAEDLLHVSDDPDVQSLYELCEWADSDVNTWTRETETGKRIQAAIERRDMADGRLRMRKVKEIRQDG